MNRFNLLKHVELDNVIRATILQGQMGKYISPHLQIFEHDQSDEINGVLCKLKAAANHNLIKSSNISFITQKNGDASLKVNHVVYDATLPGNQVGSTTYSIEIKL